MDSSQKQRIISPGATTKYSVSGPFLKYFTYIFTYLVEMAGENAVLLGGDTTLRPYFGSALGTLPRVLPPTTCAALSCLKIILSTRY
jgi:hypothetical protein